MTRITGLFRHPLKSHGREALHETVLTEGQSMPYDRTWAVAHEASKADGSEWAPCQNFTRVSQSPGLMAIEASLDTSTETLTLRHPTRPGLTFRPDAEADRFLDWVRPLIAEGRVAPKCIYRLDHRGFTDADFPCVSLCNGASHGAVEGLTQTPLSQHRWRGNIWLDGLPAWDEFNLVGREVKLGEAVLRIEDRIVRCAATQANPETGIRDVDTLGALSQFDHQDFGVYALVIQSGRIAVGDSLQVI